VFVQQLDHCYVPNSEHRRLMSGNNQ
jgi:hypothetical protein